MNEITLSLLEKLLIKLESLSNEQAANEVMIAFGLITRKLRKQLGAEFTDQEAMHNKKAMLLALYDQDSNFLSYLPLVIKYADDEEKSAIASMMSTFDQQGHFVDIMIELCRTNSLDLLIAIGLDNNYPAQYFPELNFNQLIMKLLFSQQDVSQVLGLSSRLNKELSRMASDYRQEQINAGRQVPASIELLI